MGSVTTISDIVTYWPAWAFVLVLLVWSVYHDTAYHRVLKEYARRRTPADAPDSDWPPPKLGRELAANPAVLLGASALAFISAGLLGWATYLLAQDPAAVDVFDRRLAALGCVALAVVGAWLVRSALRRYRSPWHPLASRLRRAVYASAERRDRILGEALALDPELKAG